METQKFHATFEFDPYENIRVVKNLDEEILIITRHRIKSILQEYESSLGKRELWIAPFTLLITLVALFTTSDFRNFIVPPDTWRAFFMMLSLISVVWLFKTVREAYKCKRIDDILNQFMCENTAPRVVETSPSMNEIVKVPKDGLDMVFSVTFDQQMLGGYSWCTTQHEYPEGIPGEKPHWTNAGRTCSLKMRVYPNLNYGIRFNSRVYEGFRSINGLPAEPYILEFKTVEATNNLEPNAHIGKGLASA